jgi:hypothetical protein
LIPSLKLQDVQNDDVSDSQTSSSKSQSQEDSNSNRPKIGFGLDLTKALSVQQQHLVKADASKKHARQVA